MERRGSEKVVNRDGGVAWRGGGWEGRQQGWRRGMERRWVEYVVNRAEMEVWRSPKISENEKRNEVNNSNFSRSQRNQGLIYIDSDFKEDLKRCFDFCGKDPEKRIFSFLI